MWIYEKKLQYPVKIKNPNPALAQVIISQLGGPDGELGAATRYLNQRYSMPKGQVMGMLTDIGSEELGHMEMIGAIVYQLTRNLKPEQIAGTPFAAYFVDHTTGVYPSSAAGVPFDNKYTGVKGDALADLNEDLAADAANTQEQRNACSAKDQLNLLKLARTSCFLKHQIIIIPQHHKRIALYDSNQRRAYLPT